MRPGSPHGTSDLQNAAEVMADRAKALTDAVFQDGQDHSLLLLVMACKRVVTGSWATAPAVKDEALAAYARRICIEQGVQPDTLVVCDPVPVAQLLGETPPVAFTDHLPRIEPAWVRVYRRLPSIENLDGDKLSHVRGPFDPGCSVCGATREEFDDRVISPYACPGPCTEVRLFWTVGDLECWQAPAKDGFPPQRYMHRLNPPLNAEQESVFERWKRENMA